jgi:hypothetical protein
MYTISIYRNNNTWFELSTIASNNSQINHTNIESIDIFNEKIVNQIVKYEIVSMNNKLDLPMQINTSSINGYIIDFHKYRRGTIYVVLQYSYETKQVRILLYGTNKIHHSATSFGTNPILHLNKNQIYKLVTNSINKIIDNNGKFDNEIITIINSGKYIFHIE